MLKIPYDPYADINSDSEKNIIGVRKRYKSFRHAFVIRYDIKREK